MWQRKLFMTVIRWLKNYLQHNLKPLKSSVVFYSTGIVITQDLYLDDYAWMCLIVPEIWRHNFEHNSLAKKDRGTYFFCGTSSAWAEVFILEFLRLLKLDLWGVISIMLVTLLYILMHDRDSITVTWVCYNIFRKVINISDSDLIWSWISIPLLNHQIVFKIFIVQMK